jgi:CO/xanthine dehydrogenase FAD-binding subunit
MKIETYLKPASLEEAYAALQLEPKAKLLGGGAWLKLSGADLPVAIDLSALRLSGIKETVEEVRIGAMTTLSEMADYPLFSTLCGGIVREAVLSVMGPSVRNIATLGGSVMGRFGFSDLFPVLLVLDARLKFYKQKELSISDFLEMKNPTRDLLTQVILPKLPAKGYFHKVVRTALDFALVNVAILRLDSGFRIAVGSRPGAAILCPKAMNHLLFRPIPDEKAMEEAAVLAAEEARLGSNQRASAEYRMQLVQTYVERGLREVSSR